MKDSRLERWIYDYVVAVVVGYDRRAYELRNTRLPLPVARLYQSLNCKVDNAFTAVCLPLEAEILRNAIVGGYGFERAGTFPGGKNQFYRKKRRVMTAIAVRLQVVKTKNTG